MNASIEVHISPTGDVEFEGKEFRGKGCVEATAALEAALGEVVKRDFKPEYRQQQRSANLRKVRHQR